MRKKPERITGLPSTPQEKVRPSPRQSDAIAEKAVHELQVGLEELHFLMDKLKRRILRSRLRVVEADLKLRARKNFKLIEEDTPDDSRPKKRS